MRTVKSGQLLWGKSGKQTYIQNLSIREYFQMGSVTAGCHCPVRAGAQPRLSLVTVLDAAKVCAVLTVFAGWL